MKLIPVDIETMSRKQIKTHLKNLNMLYITNNSYFFAQFF